MSFQKYEYLDENSYADLVAYENLDSEFSKSIENGNLELEYYHEVLEDPYPTYPEKYFNRRHDTSHLFNDTSNLPCYILPVMYQQPENPQLFRSDHKRIYPSYRHVRFHNSLPLSNFSDKLYTMECKDHFSGLETTHNDDEDDGKSIFTDYIANTDVGISEDNLTYPVDNVSALLESEQELESIYTSNFMYDSTLTGTNSQSTVVPLKTLFMKSCINNNNINMERIVDRDDEEENTLDSLDKFLIKVAEQNIYNSTINGPVLSNSSKPIILIYIKSFFSWLKCIPVYTYKYCLRHVLFI